MNELLVILCAKPKEWMKSLLNHHFHSFKIGVSLFILFRLVLAQQTKRTIEILTNELTVWVNNHVQKAVVGLAFD